MKGNFYNLNYGGVHMNVKKIVFCSILIIMSILFTLLVLNFDVKPVGPNNSKIGFSTINLKFSQIIGSNLIWYKITSIVGIFPVLIVLSYCILGIVQLIKRKNIKKVDFEIILLGIFYVITIMLYLFFEKFIINYRPILLEGMLEASYPSSHTMMAIFICISANIVNKRLINNQKLTKALNVINVIITLIIVFGRIISGVHWLSDIVGGILISITLLVMFNSCITLKNEK